MKLIRTTAAIAALCALATAASASTVTVFGSQIGGSGVGSGDAPDYYGYYSNTSSTKGGHTNRQSADNFSLASNSQLNVIHWWGRSVSGTGLGGLNSGIEGNAFTNILSFTITIYKATGAGFQSDLSVETPFYTGTFAANTQVKGFEDTPTNLGFNVGYRYEVTLDTALTLEAGNYYFSVTANLTATDGADWRWQKLEQQGGDMYWFDGEWHQHVGDPNKNMAFAFYYVIPLPPAAWIGLAGLAGVAVLRRRRLV